MPICNECNCRFPNKIWIDGKKRNLNRRKYCLTCSPFGSPRRGYIKINDGNRICEICKRSYIYNHKKGHTNKLCNSCSVNSRRFRIKKKMLEYKGNKCSRCGYDKSTRALDFHHRNKEEKLFNFSGCHCLEWHKIQTELDKCDLVCANCHREIEELEDKKNILSKIEIIKEYFQPRKFKTNIICLSCKKDFVPKRESQKYCCKKCARTTLIKFPDHKCCGCEKIINWKAKFCSIECAHKPMTKLNISKEELTQLIWQMPTTKVGELFNVSDKAIEKRCKKLGIEKPPRGYWQKQRRVTMFEVYDTGKLAGYPHHNVDPSFKHPLCSTFEEAQDYCMKWLGAQLSSLVPNSTGEIVDYSGVGDTIEIREIK